MGSLMLSSPAKAKGSWMMDGGWWMMDADGDYVTVHFREWSS